MPGINDLPPELKGLVLDNLTNRDDRNAMMNAALISKDFVAPATSRLFHHLDQQDLEYLIHNLPPAKQKERANQCRHLSMCTLRHDLAGNPTSQLHTRHLRFSRLRTLHFYHPSGVVGAGSELKISHFLGPRLRELTVEGVMMAPRRVANPDNYLLKMHLCPNLTVLKLERRIQGATSQHLKQALLVLRKLETVALTTRMTALVDHQVLKTLAEMDSLWNLRLEQPFLSWTTAALVHAVREPFPNIQVADFAMDSEAARLLLPKMTFLHDLTLNLLDQAPIFNSALRFLPDLTELDLKVPLNTTWTYDDMKGLGTCNNLTSLSIRADRNASVSTPLLTATEVYMLFFPLSGLEALTLRFRDSKVSTADMLNMIGGFCPQLKTLDLEVGWAKVDTTALSAGRVLFPRLTELSLSGLVLPQGNMLKVTKHVAVGDVNFGAIAAHNVLREHCPRLRKFVCGRRFGTNVGWYDSIVTQLMDYTKPEVDD